MNTSSMKRVGIASAALVAASFAVGVPVGGATTPSATPPATKLAKAKTRCIAADKHQIATLHRDTARVNAAKLVDASARKALTDQFSAAESGLQTLQGTINAATTAAQLRTACKTIVTGYRVGELDRPKVRAVLAAERLTRVSNRAPKAEARFAKAITRAQKRGVSSSAIADAQAHVTDLEAKLADARTQVDGLLTEIIPVTAAQVNDGSAKPIFDSAKTKLSAAGADAKAGRADVKAIRADLKVTK